jgi:ribosomal protein S12 methylthiotransferase
MRQFVANGYTVSHDSKHPDGEIVVINTCGFIADAKEESVNVILNFAKARRMNKINRLFVMGCLSEKYLELLQEEIPEVDKFYGKFNWKELIADIGKPYHRELSAERVLTTPGHYAYLKIAEGCNHTCSFCAIPAIAGKYQSKSMEVILEEVKILRQQGVKEFQLIAQDLTYYGRDVYRRYALPELVEKIANVPGVEWMRLHYAYPAHFPQELLRVMRERDNVCKYLDIALQHISDRMLKLMRRNINRQQTIDLIGKIREEVPGIHLRTTMMVGHPGETEKNFLELLDFVRATRFERLGAFPYSEEEFTYSGSHYDDDIPEEVKQERMNELMTLQEGIAMEVNEEKTGKTFDVMVDTEEEDYFVGRTQYDSPEVDQEVLISKEKRLEKGNIYSVKITASQSFDLYGEVI